MKKLVSILLCVALIFSIGATAALAYEEEPVSDRTSTLDLTVTELSYLNVDGETVTADPTSESITDSAEHWSWNAETKTLTLSGTTINADTAIVIPAICNVVLADGTVNTLNCTEYGVKFAEGEANAANIVISGPGTLYINGARQSTGTAGGIGIGSPSWEFSGTVKILSCTVIITGTKTGICISGENDGILTINNTNMTIQEDNAWDCQFAIDIQHWGGKCELSIKDSKVSLCGGGGTNNGLIYAAASATEPMIYNVENSELSTRYYASPFIKVGQASHTEINFINSKITGFGSSNYTNGFTFASNFPADILFDNSQVTLFLPGGINASVLITEWGGHKISNDTLTLKESSFMINAGVPEKDLPKLKSLTLDNSTLAAFDSTNVKFYSGSRHVTGIDTSEFMKLSGNALDFELIPGGTATTSNAVIKMENAQSISFAESGVDLPKLALKEGFTFMGWYDNPECVGEVCTKTVADTKYYPKWICVEHELDEEWTVDVEPEIGKEGLQHKNCTQCSEVVFQTIPALVSEHTHSYGEGIMTKAPTCTETGVMEYICTEDGCSDPVASYTKTIPATGHDWDDGTVIVKPTSQQSGVMMFTCKNDPGHTYTIRLPKLHSSVSSEAQAAGSTQVYYPETAEEAWTLTVPARITLNTGSDAPASGDVVLTGTWSGNREVIVAADETVAVENSLLGLSEELAVDFAGITRSGDNYQEIEASETISVENLPVATLFGEWEGSIHYYVVIQDVVA